MSDKFSFSPLFDFQIETEKMKLDNLKVDLNISRMETTTTVSLLLSEGAKEHLKKKKLKLIIHAMDFQVVLVL